jgi:hypothetical protein
MNFIAVLHLTVTVGSSITTSIGYFSIWMSGIVYCTLILGANDNDLIKTDSK